MEQAKAGIQQQRLPWKWLIFLVVGTLLVGWLIDTPGGLLGKADAIGYAVCHRIDARSFHLGDRQVPLCARCTGMYLGAVLGLLFQAFTGRHRGGMPSWRIAAVMALLTAAFGIDGFNSFLHLFPVFPSVYQPNNTLRLLTGTGMGLVIAMMLFPGFNQTAWQDWEPRPAISRLRQLAVLLILALGMDALVLTGNPLLLYPATLISAAGVMVILSMVYAMAWMMILRLENRYLSAASLLMPLVGGFGTALLQIIVLDAARYALTGTWEGFHFG